jgi:hypothetical protein
VSSIDSSRSRDLEDNVDSKESHKLLWEFRVEQSFLVFIIKKKNGA